MEGLDDPLAEPLDLTQPFKNEFLRYSLDLLNHGYFWESHVYFEALWNAHKREGITADFLKAMIKLGAAGVKMQLGQKDSFRAHLIRARELIDRVRSHEEDYLGFNLNEIMTQIDDAMLRDQMIFEIRPSWE